MSLVGFFAYPSNQRMVVDTIGAACNSPLLKSSDVHIQSWEEMDIPGKFIATEILGNIDRSDFVVADITSLNFNVVYEAGYAVGKGKRLILVKNRAVTQQYPTIQEVGIFDTLGYKEYSTSDELIEYLSKVKDVKPIHLGEKINERTPLYIVQPKTKTDQDGYLRSAIKKAYLYFRSHDPIESPRLAGPDAVANVAESYGVIVSFLPDRHVDAAVHNIRSAFVAGVADGLEKHTLFIQTDDTPIPMDLRDFVTYCRFEADFKNAVGQLAERVYEEKSNQSVGPKNQSSSFLAALDLGASAAENEIISLKEYYVETNAFLRASRKEVRLVTGRKGSGKTAIFFTVRNKVRSKRGSVVLDLKPDGYQLKKLKDTIIGLMSIGAAEHTITAFWEYLLWLEICHKLIDNDQETHKRDHRLYEPYQLLKAAYITNAYSNEGDFSERLKNLLRDIVQAIESKYSGKSGLSLTTPQITELVYRHDFSKLKAQIAEYLTLKDEVLLLFDNIDKGWASHGVSVEDLAIVRSLIEATRKIERELDRENIDSHTIIFLRNDIYEHLIDSMSDRGKETRANVDWDDQEVLKELVRRRMARNVEDGDADDFDTLWLRMCTPILDGESTAQYILDRCLMRPRSLLDLIGHCRGYAMNLGHEKITKDDFLKGCSAFSNDLLVELDLEIRDVYPSGSNILYAFIGASGKLSKAEIHNVLKNHGAAEEDWVRIISVLLWFGFLGIASNGGEDPKYIYTFHYNMKVMEGTHAHMSANGLNYVINPAFRPALGIS